MEEGIYYFKKEYFPKFKQSFILDEVDKEDLKKAFFKHLRNNGKNIPLKFNFTFKGHFLQYTFESCNSKKEKGILIVRPIYKAKVLSIEQQVDDLVSKLRIKD